MAAAPQAALWEEPERFDPERFSPERAARTSALCLYAVRRRPAHLHRRRLRHDRSVLILASIAQRYRLRLNPAIRSSRKASSRCARATA